MQILNKDNQKTLNPTNERVVYNYRKYLRADARDPKTITALVKYIRSYQILTSFEDFKKFNGKVADKFIEQIDTQDASESYLLHLLKAVREFLLWLSDERGYRSIKRNDIVRIKLTANQLMTARATEYKKSYKFEQILETIRKMPSQTVKEIENKAIISLQALCGLRISELRTVKIKNIIQEDDGCFVYITPKDMNGVKRGKTRQVFFLPLPEDIKENVLRWIKYLKEEESFTDKEPLFPAIPVNFKQNGLLESKVKKHAIKSNTTIREIFKKAFNSAGYEYIRPHSFRHTIARWAEKHSPELLNAIRQNLGHKSIQTTLQSYGELSQYDQGKRIGEAKV